MGIAAQAHDTLADAALQAMYAELSQEQVEAIRRSRMDPRHAHLDKILDPK